MNGCFRPAEPGFISQDEEILKGLSFLSKRFGRGGFRVLDRGYDANVYMRYFIKHHERFIIRVRKNCALLERIDSEMREKAE